MPDNELQKIHNELVKRGVFKDDPDLAEIGSELQRRGVLANSDPYGDPYITKETVPAPPKPRAPTVQEGLDFYRQQWLQGSRPDSKPAQSLLMLEMNPRSRWNEILQGYKEPSKKAIMQQAVANEKALRAEGRRKRGELGRALGETTIGAMPETPAPSDSSRGKCGSPSSSQ